MEIGDVVRILPPFYLNVAPMPYGVVERNEGPYFVLGACLVGFVMSDKKLWLKPEDVEVVGHVDGD